MDKTKMQDAITEIAKTLEPEYLKYLLYRAKNLCKMQEGKA